MPHSRRQMTRNTKALVKTVITERTMVLVVVSIVKRKMRGIAMQMLFMLLELLLMMQHPEDEDAAQHDADRDR